MTDTTALEEQFAEARALAQATNTAIETLTAMIREADPTRILDIAHRIGTDGQAREGQLIQILAHADRAKASRALTRTARAIKNTHHDLTDALTQTLEIATSQGPGEANRHVRTLGETTTPGTAEQLLAKQRARSFARILERDDGTCRIEALLDAEPAPADARTVEQLQAHALTRCAEVYLNAAPEQRGAKFTAPVLYTAPADEEENAGLAESVYGTHLPRTILTPTGNPAAHLLQHIDGQPEALDGEILDQNPAARLATPAQRTALGWRDRHCTHPGCNRPLTWALHAHHEVPYSQNGPTTLGNLVLPCTQHHQLTHHPEA
jgi:hypothetical protein